MKPFHYLDLSKVYIDHEVLDSVLARRILKNFPNEKIEIVQEEPYLQEKGALSARQFDRSKKELFVTRFKGYFFKRCPGAKPGLTCCNYYVLNLGLQCNMNCSYCYLQSFINSPVMKVYTNLDQALSELVELGDSQNGALRQQALRVGTGEVIDSLSLDPLTLYSKDLIRFFKDYPRWRLEFKTKSSFVDQFIDEPHAENVIVSFSINPQNIIEREEHGTAHLVDRLSAARRARDKKFLTAFHIDPVIWHHGWQESYGQLVDALTAQFAPDDMPYISLGALRFQPEQRHMMRERFSAQSYVTGAEVFQGADGKLRYEQSVRSEMFDFILKRFRSHSSEWKIFLCMETPESWLSSFESTPKSVSGLTSLFDNHLVKKVSTSFNETRLGM